MLFYTWINHHTCVGATGDVVAQISTDILETGGRRILLEHSRGLGMRFRLRGTWDTGEIATLRQESLTVSRLAAEINDTSYLLERSWMIQKSRYILNADSGELVGRTFPRVDGTMDVRVDRSIDVLSAMFLTYGAMAVDVPQVLKM